MSWLALVEASAPDDSGEERSRRRSRGAAYSIVFTVAARAVTVVVGLVSVPLAVHYLGVDRYGVWMTITSGTALLGWTDFGAPKAIVNSVARAKSSGRIDEATGYVTAAFFAQAASAASIVAVLATCYPVIPWARLFNVASGAAAAEFRAVAVVTLVSFAATMPLSITQSVNLGLQRAYVNQVVHTLSALGSFLGLAAAIVLHAGLAWIVLAVAAGPAPALIWNWWYCFYATYPALRPRWERLDVTLLRAVLGQGVRFLCIQIAEAILFASDPLVVAHLVGTSAVGQYSIAQRAFLTLPGLVGVCLGVLWPAYAEASASGDREWSRRALARSLAWSAAACGFVSAVVLACHRQLFSLWVGADLVPPLALSMGLALWSVIIPCINAFTTYLIGHGFMPEILKIYALLTGMAVILRVTFCELLGMVGLPWGSVVAVLVTSLLCAVRCRRKGLQQA